MSDCGDVKKVFVPSKETVTAVASGIEISEKAAEKIKHFVKSEGKKPEEMGLYVKVVKDGCSGKSYSMDLKEIKPLLDNGDKLFTKNGANLVIDKLSYMFIIGSVLDYEETLLASGFQLNNPNIKKSCSCGSSFAI